MTVISDIFSGFGAGILISIGGSVFLACENRVVGAIFFAVALLCICYKGLSLFTGRVGYMPEDHSKAKISALFLGLFGNTLATAGCGYLIALAIPSMKETARALCDGKLAGQAPWQTFVRAIFCGILMYLAVSIFRDHKTPLAILFCVPVFILSGFEHSIADMFYFAASGIVSWQAFGFLWIVIAGNAVGGMLLPLVMMIGKGRKNESSK